MKSICHCMVYMYRHRDHLFFPIQVVFTHRNLGYGISSLVVPGMTHMGKL